MKIIKNAIVAFTQMLILNACSAHENNIDIKVSIETVEKKPSFVKVVFTNESEVDYWLSVYNFCQSEVIFQDLFKVKSAEGKDLYASYAGPVDFVEEGSKTKDQFLKIKSKSSVSCEVDISQYYLTQNTGTYSVKYTAENPRFENQHSMQLVSNDVLITLLKQTNRDGFD